MTGRTGWIVLIERSDAHHISNNNNCGMIKFEEDNISWLGNIGRCVVDLIIYLSELWIVIPDIYCGITGKKWAIEKFFIILLNEVYTLIAIGVIEVYVFAVIFVKKRL